MFADPLYKEVQPIADTLYQEVLHVCRLSLQRGVTCLQNHFTKRCGMFADSLYKETCDMFADSLYKETCDMFADTLYKEV